MNKIIALVASLLLTSSVFAAAQAPAAKDSSTPATSASGETPAATDAKAAE